MRVLAVALVCVFSFFFNGEVEASENVALNKPVTVSTLLTDWWYAGWPFAAEFAVDGNLSAGSLWNTGEYSGWLMVDLGREYVVDRVLLAGDYYEWNPLLYETYNLYSGFDPEVWSLRASGTLWNDPVLRINDLYFDEPFACRYVKFAVEEAGTNWAHLNEIQVFGVATNAAPEPVSCALFVLGGGALALTRRRKTA